MDGSKCCFAARCNSGLSVQLRKQSIHICGLITVTDHDFIWLLDADAGIVDTKFVMFIKSLGFKSAPAVSLSAWQEVDEAEEWREDGWEKAPIDMNLVARVMKDKQVIAFNYKQYTSLDHWHCTELNLIHFQQGRWIENDETRRLWIAQVQVREGKK
jgi:hypothetical protein